MSKEELTALIERMNAEPDGKKRGGIVAEVCKEKGLEKGAVWAQLKEAGFDPKTKPDQVPDTDATAAANTTVTESPAEKKETVVLRHKTEFKNYRSAGLALTKKAESYQVTKSQMKILRHDPWVEIEEKPSK